jgi:hypothetical protein
LPPDHREEAVQEVIASCFVSYVRLVQRGRQQIAFASPLAHFAVRQYRAGRRIGSSANRYDVTSAYCQQRSDVAVECLFTRSSEGCWEELVVEDKRSTPADIAVTRIDFAAWLKQLDRKRRRAAKLLAGGAATCEAAAQLRVSPARISQLRQELRQDWCSFQGEATERSPT